MCASAYADEMYLAWKDNPESVHKSWDAYFKTGQYTAPPGLYEHYKPMQKEAAPGGGQQTQQSTGGGGGGGGAQGESAELATAHLHLPSQVHVRPDLTPVTYRLSLTSMNAPCCVLCVG